MNCLHVPKIMLPKKETDLKKWSVIACDQYTSEPEYWEETEAQVGEAPSTLRLILPEVYLGGPREEQKIREIHEAMERYGTDGTLRELPEGFLLVERSFGKQQSRYGLMVEIDLETYEYKKGAHSLIRPTEMTVEERIPPRLRVRQTATLELPHIMLLIDDPNRTVIEPLVEKRQQLTKCYDTDLMQEGGHVTGWFIPKGAETDAIMNQVEALAQPEWFQKRYHLTESYPLLNLAVGDGNHSMATAKAAWEKIKEGLSPEEQETHPARYCLCELVNIHDASLEIEPIHRVLFGVNPQEVTQAAQAYYKGQGCELVISDAAQPMEEPVHSAVVCSAKGEQVWQIRHPNGGIAVATIQAFLDDYLEKQPGARIDYIHGEAVVRRLSAQAGNLGFLLPEVKKEDLFLGVIRDGVLPRKTFSMGEAREKRYYMECKSLTR